MDDSLAWLRDSQASHGLSDLLCGLIRDIRLILMHPDLGNAAKLAAITGTVDQLAPPPGQGASDMQAATSVVALLARNTGPATILFEELAGERVRIELTGGSRRPLTAAECHDLRTDPGTYGYQRAGALRTADSGLIAAEVSSVIVPGRLPACARTTLGIPGTDEQAPPPSDIPLGKALAGLGVRREPLGARLVRDSTYIPGSRVAVETWARMWLGSEPVALASERVTPEFCRRAVGRLAHARDTVVQELRAS